jgi:type II secretory pathway pseudopilin PulG
MAIPSTGTTWSGAGLDQIDARFLERGKLRQVLIRDARGAATNISPHSDASGTINWSPFATDGKWRDDLLGVKRTNGVWTLNGSSNEGFHIAGAFKEGDGPSSDPSIKSDKFNIVQSNFPFDTDLVEEGEMFAFTAVETAKPLIRRLRNNLPLNAANGSIIVELPGAANSGWSRPLDGDNIERQVLLVSEFKKGGLPVYTVDGYSLCKLDDIGKSKKDKKDSEAAELKYEPLPDGYFMAAIDGVYRPVLKHTWVGGAGWAALTSAPTGQYTVTLGAPSAGTFTLTYGGLTTATIAYTAANSAVKSALVALDDGFDASDWTVSGSAGGPYVVTLPVVGTVLTGSGAGLTGGTFSVTPV